MTREKLQIGERALRFEQFLRTCNCSEDVEGTRVIRDLVTRLLVALETEFPEDDAHLLKLAALTLVYVDSVKEVIEAEVELDPREREILEAVLRFRRGWLQ